MPWRRIALTAAVLAIGATAAWEINSRARGYAPTLNDTADLWAQRREAVRPDSLVIIGDSRAWFDLDLDVLEQGLGRRPVQLALAGSCVHPVLMDLASDETFHGTVICSFLPGLFFVPAGPPVTRSEEALQRYRTWTPAQRSGHFLGMLLEERLAFLKQEDLSLESLLKQLPIPDRPGARVAPPLPPYFQWVDRERRARMIEACAQPGALQTRVKQGWPALFTPPPPPDDVPIDIFLKGMGEAMAARLQGTGTAVQKIRSRGGQVVFVRFPMSGELRKLEDRNTPRATTWDRLLKETNAPGIHFEDHPELAGFDCPEWSHLSAADSVEFTRRLLPHLKAALAP